MKIYDHTKPQLVPKLLLQVSIRELHNNLGSDTIYGGLIEAGEEDDDIIISDFTSRSLFPPQLKKCRQDKIHHYCHGEIVIKKTQRSQPKC